MDTRITILAVGGAFALGALGANALADDGSPFGDLAPVNVSDDDRRIDGKRDDGDADFELRDDEDDDRDTGHDRDQDTGNRDADSGGARDGNDSGTKGGKDRTGGRHGGTGGDSRQVVSAPAAAPAPAPAPAAPVYDDYSDDGGAYYGGGGSDYGDS